MDTTGRCLLFKDNPWPGCTPRDEGAAGGVNGGLERARTGACVHVGGPSWHGCDGEVTSWQSRVWLQSDWRPVCAVFLSSVCEESHRFGFILPDRSSTRTLSSDVQQKTQLGQLPHHQMKHAHWESSSKKSSVWVVFPRTEYLSGKNVIHLMQTSFYKHLTNFILPVNFAF